MPGVKGSIRLFTIFGISVFVHWSWFLVAVYEFDRTKQYSSMWWAIFEYLSIFAIVTLHEFGHALACRQVGGVANQIVLWPLGGVAYVSPPPRPGATLWSIVAGPLVNLVLIPVTVVGLALAKPLQLSPDLARYIQQLFAINLILFAFNIVPIYPLDGGKILRAFLWFFVGRAQSLMAATIVGFVGVGAMGLLAFYAQSPWIGILAAFAGMQCFAGFNQAKALKKMAEAPRRENVECPACHANPPRGVFWSCGLCRTPFDTFESEAKCPKCRVPYAKTACPECGTLSPYPDWQVKSLAPSLRIEPMEPLEHST